MFNSNQLPSYLKDYQIFNKENDGRFDDNDGDSYSQESDHSDEEEDDDDVN